MNTLVELKHKDVTNKILRAFFKVVYPQLGYGFLEKVYENAMVIALRGMGLKVQQQARIAVYFQGRQIGEYCADLLWEPARRAMGQTRRLAERMDLAATTPNGNIASSTYALANPGQEYVVYLPEGGEVTVDLAAVAGTVAAEWIHPVEGPIQPADEAAGGGQRTFTAPFAGDAALYLRLRRPGK